MAWRPALLLLCLLAFLPGMPSAMAADRAVVVAEKDLARYAAEYRKAGPERKAYLKQLRKLLGLTRKRLQGARSRGSKRWRRAMARLAKLDRALETKIAGTPPPPPRPAAVETVSEPLAKTPPPPADIRKADGGEATPETKPLLDLAYGAFHALVIGNNDYKHLPKLKTAVADAREVRRVLTDDYGFDVTLLENATRSDILRAVNKLRADLGPEDNLLIYYAGHGTLDRESDTGYWLPIDAEPDNDVDWIANAALTRHLKAMQANHVLVVADSCYSGTLFRDADASLERKGERKAWLGRMNEKRSRTAIASGGLEPVMDSGGGRHSVFAKAFLGALRDNDGVIDDHELYRRISRPVILEADQTPLFADIRKSGHEGGAFLFVPKR